MKNIVKFISVVLIAGHIDFSIAYEKANWSFVDKKSGDSYFIDINSLKKTGNSVTYWMKVNFNKRDKAGNLSTKLLMSVNCRTRENTVREITTYDDEDARGLITLDVRVDANVDVGG
jgi:hypothetical protein